MKLKGVKLLTDLVVEFHKNPKDGECFATAGHAGTTKLPLWVCEWMAKVLNEMQCMGDLYALLGVCKDVGGDGAKFASLAVSFIISKRIQKLSTDALVVALDPGRKL